MGRKSPPPQKLPSGSSDEDEGDDDNEKIRPQTGSSSSSDNEAGPAGKVTTKEEDSGDKSSEKEKDNSTADSATRELAAATLGAAAQGEGGEDKDDEMLNKISEAFFLDDDFSSSFESFAKENCRVFSPDDDEHKLEYSVVYKKFQELFEKKLEEMIMRLGFDYAHFTATCEKKFKDGESEWKQFLSMVMSLTDYDCFVMTMKDVHARENPK
eukprot:jgi/Mesvir1/13683/Mv02119-RA.1